MYRAFPAFLAVILLAGCATTPMVVTPVAPSIAKAQIEEVELVATAMTAKDEASDLSESLEALPTVPEPVKAKAKALASVTTRHVKLLETHTTTLATAQEETKEATIAIAKVTQSAAKTEVKAAKSSGWIVGLAAAIVGLLLLIAGYVVGKIKGIFK